MNLKIKFELGRPSPYMLIVAPLCDKLRLSLIDQQNLASVYRVDALRLCPAQELRFRWRVFGWAPIPKEFSRDLQTCRVPSHKVDPQDLERPSDVQKLLWDFIPVRKKLWLAPVIIVMLLLGALMVLAQDSAVAPFIYTLF